MLNKLCIFFSQLSNSIKSKRVFKHGYSAKNFTTSQNKLEKANKFYRLMNVKIMDLNDSLISCSFFIIISRVFLPSLVIS